MLFNPEALDRLAEELSKGDSAGKVRSQATEATADLYREKGWSAPFPLPTDEKFPPPTGVTGKISHVSWESIQKFWGGVTAKDNRNLGLRLQSSSEEYDIAAIDVDHYDTKRGDDFLTELEAQLGSLGRAEGYRSTRRPISSPSGQSFFKIPKGKSWSAAVCEDVEFVQMTHRYSAVWPSVKGNLQYQWYLGDEPCDIPDVDDLPWLPEQWVNYLIRGEQGNLPDKRSAGAFKGKKVDQYRSAINWMRENIPGWNEGADDNGERNGTSAALRRVSSSEAFETSLINNGHDSMVAAVHAAIRLGTEGHVGVKAALEAIRVRFVGTVTQRDRRSQSAATTEYENAVTGEVDSVIAEIDSGNLIITEYGKNLALPDFSEMLVLAETQKRPEGISDVWSVEDNDYSHARLFYEYWGNDILANRNGPLEREFAVWSPKLGRYRFHKRNEMFGLLASAVADRLNFEARQLEETADEIERKMGGEQQPEGTVDPDELRSMAQNLSKRANNLKNTTAMDHILKQLHSIPEIKVEDQNFDSNSGLLGVLGGKTLDTTSNSLLVRQSRRTDLLTMSTGAAYLPNATHPNWEKFLDDFLPDKEIRKFVQKALGYTLIDGNPEKLIIFLFGKNHTGKTTILEAIGSALGDYASPMNAVKLLGRNTGGPNSEVLANVSKRMVFMSEIGNDYQLSANIVKQVTGNDSQQLRGVHSSTVINRTPSFTPYVATNTVPEIVGGDQALKNRLLVIPFDHSNHFQVKKEDSIFLETVRPAILWWLIEGMTAAQEEGLGRDTWPAKVRKLSNQFSDGISPVHEFLAKYFDLTGNPKDRLLRSEVEQLWQKFCLEEGLTRNEVGSISAFRKTMRSLGAENTNTTVKGKPNTPIYRNIAMKA